MSEDMFNDDDSFLDKSPVKTVKAQKVDWDSEDDNVSARKPNGTSKPSVSNGSAVVSDSSIPKIFGTGYPKEFLEIVDRYIAQYKSLPKIDEVAIYEELSTLSVSTTPNPTPEIMIKELQQIRAVKERVTEISTDVTRAYALKKRVVDLLYSAWGYYSPEKSADKRQGDAACRLNDFDLDFAKVEALKTNVYNITKNLEAAQENLSRCASIYQMNLKMNGMDI